MTAGFCWEKWTNGSEWFLNVADDAGFLIEKCFMETCRQKSRYYNNFCLPLCPLLSLAFSKAEQNSPKLKKCSTAQPTTGPQPPGSHIKQNHPRFSAEAETRMICVKKLHDWGTAEKKEYLSSRLRDTAWIITYFLGGSKWNMFVVIRYNPKYKLNLWFFCVLNKNFKWILLETSFLFLSSLRKNLKQWSKNMA